MEQELIQIDHVDYEGLQFFKEPDNSRRFHAGVDLPPDGKEDLNKHARPLISGLRARLRDLNMEQIGNIIRVEHVHPVELESGEIELAKTIRYYIFGEVIK